jgi:phosphoglycerate dehydrogenase-like enzyme
MGARAVALDELLETSDVVTLHVPLLPSTKGLIGARELALMKPAAVLIQGSRGGIVDESALAASLASGHLGGAAIDVYENEPPEAGNPLFDVAGNAARKLLFTPHVAGVTRQSWALLFDTAWKNVVRTLVHGAAPEHRVY